MAITIKHRDTGAALYTSNTAIDLASAVAEAVKANANLARASLAGANLAGANLARAYLARASLAGANLARASLDGAYLAGANLDGASLDGAYLAGANLDGAYLAGANELIGWKKLKGGVICKLRIPADSRRSHAFGRKCRAEFVDVLEGAGVSSHDGVTKYAPGTRVLADKFDADWTHECAGGIHFFITREEAEAY